MADLGLKSELVLSSPGSVVACIHELLQLHHCALADQEELQGQLQKCKSDAKARDTAVQRLEQSLKKKKRELEDLQLQVHLFSWTNRTLQQGPVGSYPLITFVLTLLR